MEEVGGQGVQERIGQVELCCGAGGEEPVEVEGEGGEGAVRLVRATVGQRYAPEVRGEQARQGGRPRHQGVRQDCWPETEVYYDL